MSYIPGAVTPAMNLAASTAPWAKISRERAVMEIRHTALSRGIFAQGAVEAAKFMATVNAPGLYDMSQLVK